MVGGLRRVCRSIRAGCSRSPVSAASAIRRSIGSINYGIRLLEPFSHRWFYGDSIFIIDLWIWIALAMSVWLSLRGERRGTPNWRRPAQIGFTAVCAYIFVNGLITGAAERMASGALDAGGQSRCARRCKPATARFLETRDLLADRPTATAPQASSPERRRHRSTWTGAPTGMDDPRIATRVKGDPAARAPSSSGRACRSRKRTGDADPAARPALRCHPLAQDRFQVRLAAPDTASHPE